MATASSAIRAPEMEFMVFATWSLCFRFTKIDGLSFASRPKTGQLATSCCVTNIAGKNEHIIMISSQEVWLAMTIKGRI